VLWPMRTNPSHAEVPERRLGSRWGKTGDAVEAGRGLAGERSNANALRRWCLQSLIACRTCRRSRSSEPPRRKIGADSSVFEGAGLAASNGLRWTRICSDAIAAAFERHRRADCRLRHIASRIKPRAPIPFRSLSSPTAMQRTARNVASRPGAFANPPPLSRPLRSVPSPQLFEKRPVAERSRKGEHFTYTIVPSRRYSCAAHASSCMP
jgi:hypothetical protein